MPDDTAPIQATGRSAAAIYHELADAVEKFAAAEVSLSVAQAAATDAAKVVAGLKSELSTIETDAEGLIARAVKFVEGLV